MSSGSGEATNPQSAYHLGRTSESVGVDRDIHEAMRLYLIEDLGLDNKIATARADQELTRKTALSALEVLEQAGIKVSGLEVLDLGSGLGTISEELVLQGARVVALEPGAAWAHLTQRRVSRHRGYFRLVQAFGEAIPLPSSSVDLVVSLQVLEHVRRPAQVLSEVWRVLRPGGHFYLACENYLTFREPHYRVAWFPLMPKCLGVIYLRLLGRDPAFLRDAITYITYPGVLRMCRNIGFIRLRDDQVMKELVAKKSFPWQAMRTLAKLTGSAGPLWIDRIRVAFKPGIYEVFTKRS